MTLALRTARCLTLRKHKNNQIRLYRLLAAPNSAAFFIDDCIEWSLIKQAQEAYLMSTATTAMNIIVVLVALVAISILVQAGGLDFVGIHGFKEGYAQMIMHLLGH
jgi:isoprenylcysteine carboxyl methyltransferase (ICMT) family protein YpbQ